MKRSAYEKSNLQLNTGRHGKIEKRVLTDANNFEPKRIRFSKSIRVYKYDSTNKNPESQSVENIEKRKRKIKRIKRGQPNEVTQLKRGFTAHPKRGDTAHSRIKRGQPTEVTQPSKRIKINYNNNENKNSDQKMTLILRKLI